MKVVKLFMSFKTTYERLFCDKSTKAMIVLITALSFKIFESHNSGSIN